MKQSQENSRQMGIRVQTVLSGRSLAIIAEMTGVSDAVTNVNTQLLIAKEKAIIQAIDRSGQAVQKADYRKIMVERTMEPLNRAISYARNINDPFLVNELEETEGHLMAMGYPECAIVCEARYNTMLPLLTDLASVGVTAPMLADMLTSITTFNDYSEVPRQGINEKKAATKGLEIALDSVETSLIRIDSAVLMLKNTYPDFVEAYFNAREIINVGGRTIALRVRVTDADGLPLANVMFDIDAMKLDKKTTAKGNLQMKHLQPGPHVARLIKYGYKNVDIDFYINNTERTDLTIIMDRIAVEA